MKDNTQRSLGAIAKARGNRRSFLQKSMAAGALTMGAGLLTTGSAVFADSDGDNDRSGKLTPGDAAILRFLAAAEIIESDLWLQYQELAGDQNDQNEVAIVAAGQIPGYPNTNTGGNPLYTSAVNQLDADMFQYIHDNTDDELTHETFINAYLASKGASTVNLDPFRTLPSSTATGANKGLGRLTNLTQLTLDTSWWTRYRSSTQNPDFGDNFQQAIPTLAVGKHTAIPRKDQDTNNADFLQAIANTAGFHFATIEQGGSSLYPQLAQRVNSVEVLRILLSIGGTEIMHFQTWQDKAGNCIDSPPGGVVDPASNVVVFFDLQSGARFKTEDFQNNLIMPEPTEFLHKNLPAVSIIRPTETKNAAMGAVNFLVAENLFLGQSPSFMAMLADLAADADRARREV
jgi:hypothetical protein